MKYASVSKHFASSFVILALTFLAFGSTDSENGGGSSSSSAPDKISAWVMAQQFVKDNLKSPSSADFGSVFGDYQKPDNVVTDLGGGKFQVNAWVDAQNSFGAKIRTRFVCELQYVGNDRWKLTSFAFLE